MDNTTHGDTNMNNATFVYYSEKHNEYFNRTSLTYGYSDKYDIDEETEKGMNEFLSKQGFELIGIE